MRATVWGRRAGGEQGAAAVEFALLAPLLLALLFGIITYGYMLSFRQAMSQGAGEGARSAAVWATSFTSSQDADRIAAAKASIDEALGSYGVTCGSGATCTVEMVTCGNATCVRVTVSYPYASSPLTPSFPLVPLPSRLSYTTEARVS